MRDNLVSLSQVNDYCRSQSERFSISHAV
jgi:hypothetical protein